MTMYKYPYARDITYVYAWGASARLHDDGHIMGLWTRPMQRGKGAAKRLLREIVNHADAQGMTLTLTAGAYGDKPVPTPELVKLYSKFGFQVRRGYKSKVDKGWNIPMIRKPQNNKSTEV